MIRGGNEIISKSVEAIKNDGFYFIGITGEKGNGKSTLGWWLEKEILSKVGYELDFVKDMDKLLNHLIFTIDDFFSIKKRDTVKWDDGRVCVAIWDDFGLHTSSYAFLRGEGDKVSDFVEMFEVVRENIAVLIVTAATFDLIPPKIRNSPNIVLDVYRRGRAKVYNKKRLLWFELVWKAFKSEITFDDVPKQFYNEYRKIKAKAIDAKRMMRVIKLEEKAEKLASKLTKSDWENTELLIAYGICDIFGNITNFGELVKKYYNGGNGRSGSDVLKMSFRKFVEEYRQCGLKGDNNKLLRFYNRLKEVGYVEEVS
ncbi:hypothetical protein Asulf_00953 [Archaeoglobus sulfaticallidus PM70-1]|uniref:Uncharacterized protein n=2 Tax=Archaeoglobus TaxID=2233 RepID=N0BFC1_9EURY|nr:hypothetical protein Asulf_00953 [Archaeoglobus sulfaticallidus PM70-1]